MTVSAVILSRGSSNRVIGGVNLNIRGVDFMAMVVCFFIHQDVIHLVGVTASLAEKSDVNTVAVIVKNGSVILSVITRLQAKQRANVVRTPLEGRVIVIS